MVRLGELPGADRLIQTNAFHGLAYMGFGMRATLNELKA